jgi:hypothetical protein
VAVESIGSVSVLIGGDYSSLLIAFGQAQAAAQKAGAGVASAFNAGAGAAPQIVNQFGQAVTSAGAASSTAAPQVGALSAQTAGLATNATAAANALVQQAAASHAGLTQIQATSGALRVLEGSGGIRAAERFLTMIPGLGAALVAVFPLVGAIAFFDVLVKIGGELAKFYAAAAQGPERVRGAFAELNAGLETTNDELQLANDKLDNQIAKLTGKQENVLKEMIDEAALAVDRLGAKLDSALKSIIELQNKEQLGFFQAITTNQATSTDFAKQLGGASGEGGEREEIRAIQDTARERIAAAREEEDLDSANGARAEARNALQGKYTQLIRQATEELEIQQAASKATPGYEFLHFLDPDRTKNIELATGLLRSLRAEAAYVQKEFANVGKQQELTGLKAEGRDKEQGDPAGVARIRAEEALVHQRAELSKKLIEAYATEQRQIAQIQIDGITAADGRTIAGANADIAEAEFREKRLLAIARQQRDDQIALIPQLAAKEKVGKAKPEQDAIDIQAGEKISAANAAFSLTELELAASTVTKKNALRADEASWRRHLLEETDRFLDEQANKEIERAARVREAQAKATEIQAKSQGDSSALAIERQKLLLEQQYSLQVGHTGAQEIANAKAVIELDALARQQRIEGATNAVNAVPNDDKNIERRAQLEAELKKLQDGANNANIAANTKLLDLMQKISLQAQIQKQIYNSITEALPQALGGALAKGILDHKVGESIGQDIVKALKGVGQSLLGGIFTAAIHSAVQSIVDKTINKAANAAKAAADRAKIAAAQAQAAETGANTTALGTQTAAETANTAALEALTAALNAANGQIGGAPGAAPGGHASTVTVVPTGGVPVQVPQNAGSVGARAEGTAGNVGGGVGAAAGGIFTRAIQKLEQVILRGIGVDQKQTQALNFNSSEMAASTASANAQAVQVIAATNGNTVATNVNTGAVLALTIVVAINDAISLFSGGAVAGGGSISAPSLVGEKGPEIFVPHSPGTVIPNHALKGYAAGAGLHELAAQYAGKAPAHVHLKGFATGGFPPIGVPSIIGEKGPELFIPREHGAIVPNHMLKGYAEGAGLDALHSSGGARAGAMHTTAFSGDMHIHLTQNKSPREHAQQIFRELPGVAKARGAQWSPYS